MADDNPEQQEGIIKMFNQDKGFGFITPDGGSSDLFMHVSEICDEDKQPIEEGQRVVYKTIIGRNGKPAAGKIKRSASEQNTSIWEYT